MTGQWYFVPKGTLVPVLSSHIEETWFYAAELEDSKVEHLSHDDVYIWMPDYAKNPGLLKDR
ncbi:MAG: hypothetical protein DDT31_00008 [Syntrophomonadaceae bacterium]|nr:hypothetical protein [Bacillota bacterium]